MSESDVVNVGIELAPTVFDFFQATDFVTLIVGPVGSGKSSGCCLKGTIKLAREMPAMDDGVRRSRGCVIRNTYPQLRDTTIRTFKEWLRNAKLDAAAEWKVSEHTCTIRYPLDDGTRVEVEVLFRALDRPQDVENLLSLELTWVYINEWREVPKAVTDLVQTRVGRYPRKEDVPRYWTGVFGDSNAFDTDHYLYKLFFEPDPETGEIAEGHRVFVQPGGLDPDAENIERLDACFDPRPEDLAPYAAELGKTIKDPEVKAAYRKAQMARIEAGEHEKPCRCYYPRMMKGKKQSWIDCYVHNKFVFAVDGKPIYDNFNQRVHVQEFDKDQPNYYKKLKQVYLGNDFGLTPAAVFAHVMPNGQIRVSHEIVTQRMGAIQFGKEQAEFLKKTFPGATVEGWGDPAGLQGSSIDEQKTPISVVQGCGVPISAAPTNDPVLRQDAVRDAQGTLTYDGEPEIIIHPRCVTLIKAHLGAYCLKRKQVSGDEQFRDVPDKNNPWSHVAEALQYLFVGLGRDRRVLDGGHDTPERVQSVHTRRSVGSEEDGPRTVAVQVIRSTSRR